MITFRHNGRLAEPDDAERDTPLVYAMDLFGIHQCGEQPAHGSLLRDLRFPTSIAKQSLVQ